MAAASRSSSELRPGRARDSGFYFVLDITRLKNAEDELRRALRARDEFLSVASHEMGTPLTALQLNLQSLQRKLARSPGGTVDTAPVHATVSTALKQIERQSHLLSNLLEVSRIQTNRLHLNLEAFDLCESLREIVSRMAMMANERHSELKLEGCEPLIGYWDRLRIDQVVSNLISNALKYGEGKPVTVSLRREGDLAAVCVRDQGMGIPAEDLSRIFDRFTRATSLHRAQSFGLGLSISNDIVKAHGGRIEVESRPGKGSTFTVLLPIHRVPRLEKESS